jgi:phosphosulfolactate phosphohydrolase-like enzyme
VIILKKCVDIVFNWRILMNNEESQSEESLKVEEKSSEEALPGSWIESSASEGTQILSSISAADLLATASAAAAPTTTSVSSAETPQLIVCSEGEEEQVFDLTMTDNSDPDTWVIGRNKGCDIALNDPSVSSRHAQLIHQGGRWKIVSLVSTNGLYINGDKKLTAYLANGDDIIIGSSHLVFSLGTSSSESAVNNVKPKGFMQKFKRIFK